ncbi:hypothetical protein O6H91_05G057800 [Diphasiastrum complanatum]|uniref:Uncharacterized protein n=1 Tax=Diphasiastrum complanatum TaxID=34168 RepID=A0ACC2DNJ8_DIPCM|nr:hypothetical protein O6H91_05G057800 [Diphasiastrum complanatum]
MGAEPGLPASLSIVLQEPMLVAPAEPTENFIYFLSNLDQNVAYILRTVYFYEAREDKKNEDPANVLRDALRKVLVHYRPVAGRLGISSDGKLNVICNDQGVLFVEGDADATLVDITDTTTLTQFVYNVPSAKNILEIPLMIVQVTRLKCGGFVVGLAMNHAVYDGIAAMEFLNSWAETTRGVPISVPPYLDRSVLKHRVPFQIEFPHIEFTDIEAVSKDQQIQLSPDVVQYSSFCFDEQSLGALKRNLLQEGLLKKCTTFEALTALVWRARTKALNVPYSQQAKLLFAVNSRSRLVPPLPTGFFGNGILFTCAMVTAEDLTHKSLSHAVGLVQEAIKMVDDKYMRSAIDYFEQTRARPSLTSTLLITTWSRLSLNAIDHGWGYPVHSGPVTLPEPEVVLFLSCGQERKSIKVVLGLPAAAMERFSKILREESLATNSSQFENKIKELTLWDIM